MGLFDFLKKKQKPAGEFSASNRLEELLIEAANNPALRPNFYRQLFHFDLLVLGSKKDLEDGSQSISLVAGEVEGEKVHYAFTSEETLRYVATTQNQEFRFVGLSAYDFFQMLSNQQVPSGVVLNSGTPYVKHFTSSEVCGVLKDQLGNPEQREVKKETKVRVGQPQNFPSEFVTQLQIYTEKSTVLVDILFGQHEMNDTIAYVAVLCPADGTQEADIHQVLKDLGIIANEIGLSQPLDMAILNADYARMFEEGALVSVQQYNR